MSVPLTDRGPALFLFDLGGVVVHYDPITHLAELVPVSGDRETITRRWANLPALHGLETGRCPPDEFAAAVIAEFGLRATPAEFLDNFALWDRPMAGAVELLRSLREKYRVACLSNNNPVHWDRLCEEFAIDREFDATYLSYEIGIMKPDRRIYEHVLSAEGVAPRDVVFLDDNAENVAAARGVGIAAFQCAGIDAVRRQLDQLLTDTPATNIRGARS
jgi:HAD superfamily hydrolase (TIGR01509 family)